jgi:hypothetical protein
MGRAGWPGWATLRSAPVVAMELRLGDPDALRPTSVDSDLTAPIRAASAEIDRKVEERAQLSRK